MKISDYSTLSTPSAGDLLAVFDSGNSDTRKLSLSALSTYILAQSSVSGYKQEYTTQYAAPSLTDFSVQVTDGSDNIWLLLTPTDTFADGEIVLPSIANAIDKQEVTVFTTQEVTTLVVNDNGASNALGAPTSLQPNDSFTLRYDALTTTWYCVSIISNESLPT